MMFHLNCWLGLQSNSVKKHSRVRINVFQIQIVNLLGGGSDVASLKTTAVRKGDDLIINGQKVSNSHFMENVNPFYITGISKNFSRGAKLCGGCPSSMRGKGPTNLRNQPEYYGYDENVSILVPNLDLMP